jgi:iron complex outermembrane recepter protein
LRAATALTRRSVMMLAVLGLPILTSAQTQPSTNDSARTLPRIQVEGAEEPVYTATHVATGTKTDTPLIDVPQTINVVTRELIEDRGATRLRDALETVPSVLPSTGYGGLDSGQVYSRGFFTENVYRDGFRDFAASSPHDLAAFERIEVLKGPGSVLYGSNEPGGVVNYVTKRPSFDPEYSLKLQLGSYNARRVEGDAAGPLGSGDRFAYRLAVAYEDSDSHRDFVELENRLVAPSLTWRVADGTSLTMLLEYLESEYTFERGLTADPEMFALPIGRFLDEPGQNYAKLESKRGVLMLDHALNSQWQLRAAASYLEPEATKLAFYPFSGLLDDRRTFERSYDYDETYSKDWALQAEAVGKFGQGSLRHALLIGAERSYYIYDYWFGPFDLISTIDILEPVYGQVTPPPELFVPTWGSRYGSRTDALYIQDQMDLGEHWKVLAGVRYDRSELFYEDTISGAENFPRQTQKRASPRVGVVFKPRESTALYASYSTSFKPQIFSARPDGEVPKPEIGKQLEIGVKQEWSTVAATAAIFEIRKRNVSTTDPSDPLTLIQTGEQQSRGAELEVQGRVLPQLQLSAGVSFLRAKVSRDEDIPVGDWLVNAPRRQGNVWLKYTPTGERGWYFGGGLLYASEREVNLPNTGVLVPEATRIDAMLGFEADRWSAQLNGRNLTDRKLYDAWSGFVIPQPDRSFSARVAFDW